MIHTGLSATVCLFRGLKETNRTSVSFLVLNIKREVVMINT